MRIGWLAGWLDGWGGLNGDNLFASDMRGRWTPNLLVDAIRFHDLQNASGCCMHLTMHQ